MSKKALTSTTVTSVAQATSLSPSTKNYISSTRPRDTRHSQRRPNSWPPPKPAEKESKKQSSRGTTLECRLTCSFLVFLSLLPKENSARLPTTDWTKPIRSWTEYAAPQSTWIAKLEHMRPKLCQPPPMALPGRSLRKKPLTSSVPKLANASGADPAK